MLDIPHSLKIGTSSQRNLLQNQTDPRAFGRANVLCGEHPPGPDHPGFLEKTAHDQETKDKFLSTYGFALIRRPSKSETAFEACRRLAGSLGALGSSTPALPLCE